MTFLSVVTPYGRFRSNAKAAFFCSVRIAHYDMAPHAVRGLCSRDVARRCWDFILPTHSPVDMAIQACPKLIQVCTRFTASKLATVPSQHTRTPVTVSRPLSPYPHLKTSFTKIQASGEDAGLHDVAWVSNPYVPYAPGDKEGREAMPEATAGGCGAGGCGATDGSGTDGGVVDGSGLFSREGGDGSKAPSLRIPAMTNRRTRRVARD